MSEEFELSEQYEDENLEEEITLLQEYVSTYVGKIKEIQKQENLGVEVEDQTKIGDMISDGKRREGESFDEYKMRMKAERLISKHYKKGVRRFR